MYSVHSILDLRRKTIVFMDVLLLEVEEEVLLLVVVEEEVEEPLTLLLVLVLCSYAAIANGFRFIPNLSIACRNDTADVPPSSEDDVEVAEVSAADDDDEPLPLLLFEEVDDRNGLPLLRRR